ncbi:hypothetical protein RISK_002253 [Rhodopirellula islandica]|uniref:Uncharacterized protein n=1 Tax=Rhodopirellula islandica TaxID=595434 RepID=A0A0J1BGF9_RHOIS|nr:hypothetical protein RISK_002253 [Rhodopirellula islandica]
MIERSLGAAGQRVTAATNAVSQAQDPSPHCRNQFNGHKGNRLARIPPAASARNCPGLRNVC